MATWGKTLGIVCLVGALLLPSLMVTAQSGDGLLTWEDAPAPLPNRHEGDARVRWGWETSDNIYGPFFNQPFQVGDRTTFLLGSSDNNRELVMRYRSQYAYFWFEPEIDVAEADLIEVAERFDNQIWPLDRLIFGKNATPGIDGDTRIHLVHFEGYFPGLLGYFNPDDQCATHICRFSNQLDAIYMLLNQGPFGSAQYYATLAHEFQHLIQFNLDGNEYRWLDEGLAQLAEHLNGMELNDINDFSVEIYLENPNHLMNSWSTESEAQARYYGAAYLFLMYLYERFGIEFIQALAQNPLDGLASVADTLQQTGQGLTLNAVFADWLAANYVDDPYIAEGQYYYQTYNLPDQVDTFSLASVPRAIDYIGEVNQYGAEYLEYAFPGTFTARFRAPTTTPLVDVEPTSGDWMWWSFNATGSASTLTRRLDLRNVDSATLNYKIWWDTGQHPSYLHVMVSTDDGARWEPLSASRMRFARRGFVDAPGAHYTGDSVIWLDDTIDLSDFAGQEILLRFEYVTNNLVSGAGFLLDDIAIPEIGLLDDVETLDENWVSNGFVRTGQQVTQDWSLTLITHEDVPRVQHISIEAGKGDATITFPEHGGVLVVSAMAPFTQQPAEYHIVLEPIE